jgi:GNAT superfamily N-acetyltransferase
MDDPALRALLANEALTDLGNERFEAEGATFVRNREVPDIWDANHVTEVTASTPQEIERLLERVEREYAGFAHRRFDVDFTTPPQFEARLALEGYRRSETLVMLLEGDLRARPKPHEIRPVESEADWEAYTALHDIDWREYRDRMPGGAEGHTEKTAEQMMRSRRSKSPPLRVWMACVEGEPRAYASSWGGVSGVGQVEDVFTHPDSRHRGLATALIAHGVTDARQGGAGPVVIAADPKDTPKQMYAAMGFRPVAVKRDYLKQLKR